MVRSELISWGQWPGVQGVLTDTVQECTPVSSRYTPGSRTLWRRESRINNSVDQYLFTIQDDANKHEYYDTETCSCLVTMITSISIITVAHCSITSLLTIALDIYDLQEGPRKSSLFYSYYK